MSGEAARRILRRQQALRKLLLDDKGRLTPNAAVVVSDMRRFCKADGSALIQYSPVSGTVDPVATAVAAARREVFDRYVRLLGLDVRVLTNMKDDDQ